MASKKKEVMKVDMRTREDLLRTIKKKDEENEALRKAFREKWDKLCPQLPDELRERAKTVWRAAQHADMVSTEGEPGPIAVIAAALLDAEKIGPRRLKGGVIDPVVFIAGRIESIAEHNGKDPLELLASLKKRMEADPEDEEALSEAEGDG